MCQDNITKGIIMDGKADRNNDGKRDSEEITTPCNKLSMFSLFVEKDGEYTLTLGFHKKPGESKADFEKRLQTDFAGELTVYANGENVGISTYHDFSGFSESLGGTSYGPTYKFNVDCPWDERGCYIVVHPSLKSKEANAYTLSISHHKKTFLNSLFARNNGAKDKPIHKIPADDKNDTTIPLTFERADIYIERPKSYIGYSVSFPFKTPVKSYADLLVTIDNHYNGKMNILFNNILLREISTKTKMVESGPGGYNGVSCHYGGWANGFDINETGVYSFIPEIFSSDSEEFKKVSHDNKVFHFDIHTERAGTLF
jgi:hypothetical protein